MLCINPRPFNCKKEKNISGRKHQLFQQNDLLLRHAVYKHCHRPNYQTNCDTYRRNSSNSISRYTISRNIEILGTEY